MDWLSSLSRLEDHKGCEDREVSMLRTSPQFRSFTEHLQAKSLTSERAIPPFFSSRPQNTINPHIKDKCNHPHFLRSWRLSVLVQADPIGISLMKT
jgi:hypothetical protein